LCCENRRQESKEIARRDNNFFDMGFMVKRALIFSVITGVVVYLCWFFFYQTEPPRGIILISLDTLRADHLGIYGYHRDTSPCIDAFAKENIVFENAVSQSPWTLPAHMSIMTSLYPPYHGAKKKTPFLPDDKVTLAELLSKAGYQTAAFTDGGYLSAEYGYDKGFAIYDDKGGGIAKILPKVREWLGRNKTKPFFLFIHCYDIHSPYNPPLPYNKMFHDFTYSGFLIPSYKQLNPARDNKLKLSEEDLRHFIALYDGGIRYTDNKIGEFLSYLKETGLYEKSLIIITSDHGEEFNEHGSYLHWQVYYRPNLHVPLVMHIPGYTKKETRVSELVELIDLFPTVLEIVRLPLYPKAQGRSLLPLIKKEEALSNDGVKASFAENNEMYSIITDDGYQMVSDLKLENSLLFNLKADPLAENNIAEVDGDITKSLFSKLQEFNEASPDLVQSTIGLTGQTQQQLEALGYIDVSENASIPPGYPDWDKDGILNEVDNCPDAENANQEDRDGDGIGDVCDGCPDIANAYRSNIDEDLIPDACDDCVDTDWDGYGNPGFPGNTCEEDNCPYVFNPDQEEGDGDGIGDLCEPSWLEYLWLEAEQVDTISNPLIIANDANASEGKYIYSPNGTLKKHPPGSVMATYRVEIEKAGVYLLWGRVIAGNKQDDSFFVQIDDGPQKTWHVELGKSWHWDAVNNHKKEDPVRFKLAQGKHVIKIKLREDGTKLDKMLLTNDMVFAPKN
jgi:arylsulfatase A-like enzyme